MFDRLYRVLNGQGIILTENALRVIEQTLVEMAGGSPAAALTGFEGLSLCVNEGGGATAVLHFNHGCPDGQPPDVTSEVFVIL